MTPDVRSFYAALGIHLPDWADLNASVRCFADSGAHQNGDGRPSCSVSVITGAWKCHGCGARGGAYDAAIARGHTPRSAMDLMVACGLVEPRQLAYRRSGSAPARPAVLVASQPPRVCRPLEISDPDIHRWAAALDADGGLMRRLILERAWSPQAIHELGIGFDGERITVPIRDANGGLRGLLRYDPFGELRPKVLAVRGTRLGLIPHPTRDLREHILLAEGPPDMIAARSSGAPAIAVPGAAAWRAEWAKAFTGRQVTVVMDCDVPGREAARRIAHDLAGVAQSVDVVDLDAERNDGYDLTDRIREHRRSSRHRSGPRPIAWPLAVLLETVSTTRTPMSQEAHT